MLLSAIEISGDTPAARLGALRALPSDVLVDRLMHVALQLRALPDDQLSALAALVGLPVAEVVASPFALRAVALAATHGAATANHETRAEIPWPEGFTTDPAVADDPHGYWDRGVLQAGKYRSFMQDEPFARFNPNHMSKWGPHELTHRSCGFFWRADASRWETYLGARLNELVPVVLWYGLDEIARLDRVGFDRVREAGDRVATMDRATWRTDEEAVLRARIGDTLKFLFEGLDHFDAEIAAVDAEIATGQVVSVPHAFLDASSDAIAYVVGHYDRLASEEFGALGDALFSGDRGAALGVVDDIRAYRDAVADVLDTLLFAPIEVDFVAAAQRKQARVLWDVAHRAVHHERFRPRDGDVLEPVADAVHALYTGADADTIPALTALLSALPRSGARTVLRTGLDTPGVHNPSETHDLELLSDGLASLAPATAAGLISLGWTAETLVAPGARTDLVERLGVQVERYAQEDGNAWLRSLFAFERAIAATRARDDIAERLNDDALPEAGFVSRSAVFQVLELQQDPVAIHGAWAEGDGIDPTLTGPPSAYLIGAAFEGVSVVPAPANVQRLWAAMGEGSLSLEAACEALHMSARELEEAQESGTPDAPLGWLDELAAACAIVVLPAV